MDGVHITTQIDTLKSEELVEKKSVNLQNTPNMRVYQRMEVQLYFLTENNNPQKGIYSDTVGKKYPCDASILAR